MKRNYDEKKVNKALIGIYAHSIGYREEAKTDEEIKAVMDAFSHGLRTAKEVAEATNDTESAIAAGIYEFDLHYAVSRAK